MTGRRTILDLVVVGPQLPLAACKGRGDLWDGSTHGETVAERQERQRRAVRICGGCPERLPCLRYRLDNPKLASGGVWGGRVFEDPPRSHCDEKYRNRKGGTKKMRHGVCAYEKCDIEFDTLQHSRRFCSRKHRRAQELIDRRARDKAARQAA
jgi:hypothetical protein